MSKLKYSDNPLGSRLEIWTNNGDEKVGTFWLLNCDKHGDVIHLTDGYGSDFCIDCVKERLQPTTTNEGNRNE